MNRITKILQLGNGQVRHVTRLETDECLVGTPEYRWHQFEIFKALADNPALTQTGPRDFDSGRIFYDGRSWVFELQCDIKP